MQQIKTMLGFPSGTPIDAVTARITKTYKRREVTTAYGPKTIQDGLIEDGTGTIKFKAWSHPELSPLEGKEFVIHADGKGKGLLVKHESYEGKDGPKTDILLEVGKSGQFQLIAVYKQTNGIPEATEAPKAPAPSPAPRNPVKSTETANADKPYVSSDDKRAAGQRSGMATNKAIDIILSSGQLHELYRAGELEESIVRLGGVIAKAALRLESGDFGEKAKVPSKPAANVEKLPPQSNGAGENDMDVPF